MTVATAKGPLKYGLRETVRLADNVTPFAALLTLKQDDPDGHAKALAEITGSAEFAEKVNEMAMIHIFCLTRINRDQILFQTNFDADVVTYFEGFKDLEAELRAVIGHFEGSPSPDSDFTGLIEFMAAHQADVIQYYCAYPELTVNQIRRDADWRMKVIELQRNLAKPPGKVVWGQATSAL
ncbi:MAG: hypothetical protein QNJ46_29715 [Leptolyngbyaceae cyanobacterium MO_188.B28]|nr:hypothetical protein [Leptolyngbyaceae cyanobacterium MO_188.B28]